MRYLREKIFRLGHDEETRKVNTFEVTRIPLQILSERLLVTVRTESTYKAAHRRDPVRMRNLYRGIPSAGVFKNSYG